MSKIIVDDQGNEETVFTAEELKAQQDAAVAAEVARVKAEHEKAMADKDAHIAEKLDQFKRAQGGAETEKENAKLAIENAQKTADEAKAAIARAEAEKIETKKDYWIKSVVGDDAELAKTIRENFDIINMPSSTDEEIKAKMQKAINMAGIGAVAQPSSSLSFGAAMPPNIVQTESSIKEHNYNVWKNELGLQDFVPKKP